MILPNAYIQENGYKIAKLSFGGSKLRLSVLSLPQVRGPRFSCNLLSSVVSELHFLPDMMQLSVVNTIEARTNILKTFHTKSTEIVK